MMGGGGFHAHRQGAIHFFKQGVYNPVASGTVLVMKIFEILNKCMCSLNTASLKQNKI